MANRGASSFMDTRETWCQIEGGRLLVSGMPATAGIPAKAGSSRSRVTCNNRDFSSCGDTRNSRNNTKM
jgi:hypothetical protein